MQQLLRRFPPTSASIHTIGNCIARNRIPCLIKAGSAMLGESQPKCGLDFRTTSSWASDTLHEVDLVTRAIKALTIQDKDCTQEKKNMACTHLFLMTLPNLSTPNRRISLFP